MAPRKDADALMLQISADLSRLEKNFDRAVAKVNSGSKTMEDRATKFAKTFGNANDNAVQKLSHGIGTVLGDSINNLSKNALMAGTVLDGFGAAGVAAAAGIGALLLVLNQAKAAVAFGDAIADQAAKVGVSTDTLQEYRYAIHQLGGDYDDADETLSKFTQTLGKAQLGFSKKALKPFAALGFSKEDLNDFRSADEALQVVIERLAGIQDESKRQALASALGLEKFIPLAREGAAKLEELRAAAHRLGYVMDKDLIAKSGEANDKLEDLQAIANVQLKSAFVDLAPVILSVAGALADAAREVNKISRDVKDAMPVLKNWFDLISKANDVVRKASPLGVIDQLGGGVRVGLDRAAEAGRLKSLRTGVADLLAGKPIDLPPEFKNSFRPKTPNTDLVDQSAAATAPRDMNAERTEAVNALLASAARDLLQAQNNLTESVEERARNARQIAAQELAQDLARLNKAKADLDDEKGISDATRATLKAKIDEAAVLAKKAADARQDLINRDAEWAAEDRADETRKLIRDAEIDRLRLQADLATTQSERDLIERQILKLRQDELVHLTGKEISRLEETGAISPEEAARRSGAAAAERQTDRDRFELEHEGPLKKYLRGIQDLNTEMQNAGVRAIEGLASGLADAAVNARNLGDVGSQVFKQIAFEAIEALIKIGAQKVGDIANFWSTPGFGGYREGGYLGAFANGGGLLTGPGTGTSDSILATNGQGQFARFSDGEFIVNAEATRRHRALLEDINAGRIGRFASGGLLGPLSSYGVGGGLGGAPITFDLRGAVITEDLLMQINAKISASESRSVVRGAKGGAALAQSQARLSTTNRLGRG